VPIAALRIVTCGLSNLLSKNKCELVTELTSHDHTLIDHDDNNIILVGDGNSGQWLAYTRFQRTTNVERVE
jgi:hypothetical protein